MVRDKGGGSLVVHCFCVCSGIAMLERSLGKQIHGMCLSVCSVLILLFFFSVYCNVSPFIRDMLCCILQLFCACSLCWFSCQ